MRVMKENWLIGRKVKIIKSRNKTLEGLEGLVIDETKNMIIIESKNELKKVLKKEVRLDVTTQEGSFIIEGSDIIGRVEDRFKKKVKVKSRW